MRKPRTLPKHSRQFVIPRYLGWVAGLSVWLCSAWVYAVDLPTIYDHAVSVPLGGRAAAMAGAHTALGCQEGAMHYNPAALACATRSRLELSANSYVLDSMSVPNAFGPGDDFRSLTFSPLPAVVGGTWLLRKGAPDGTGALALGVSVELPQSINLRAEPVDPSKSAFVSLRSQDSLTTADLGVGYQLSRHIAFGATIGLALRLFDHRIEAFQAGSGGPGCQQQNACGSMLQFSYRDEGYALAARARLGLRIRPSRRWAMGLHVSFPSLNFVGTNQLVIIQAGGTTQNAQSSYDAMVLREDAKSELSLPLRMAAGLAWTGDRVTITGDVRLGFPRQVAYAFDGAQTTISDGGTVTAEQPTDVTNTLNPGWQPNGALGVEVKVSPSLVLLGGAFSNISSISAADVEASERERLHMFGGTFGVGFLSQQAGTYLGLMAQGGRANIAVYPDLFSDTDGPIDAGASSQLRWQVAGFISYSYHMFSDDELRALRRAAGAKTQDPKRQGDGLPQNP